MAPRIQPLPEDVIHRIAAGEVIDSLAAAVRELAENAIDAGATRITISVWPGQWKVRVADNGAGMSLEDLQCAATSHSTSKIFSDDDLWQIASLGFRGEALHSLAQLADLEIVSRLGDAWEGWALRYDHQGKPLAETVVAIAPGTIVTASNLFGNWLGRRQSLANPSQQLREVQLIIAHLALCHPHITWQVQQDEREWFSLWAGETAIAILPQLLRDVQPSDLREISLTDDTTASIYLLLGLPDRCHRYRPDWVKVAVNGRVVRIPTLEQTLLHGFRRTLPRDRHPVCFLHLHLPPDQVDWNRHPAKVEIFLRQMDRWQQQVEQAIAQALSLPAVTLPETAYSQRLGQLLKTAEASGVYANRRTVPTTLEQPLAEPGLAETQTLSETTLSSPLKAIAQLHKRYIVAEHPSGIWLIEQHIAHERVIYEQLCDRWQLVSLEPPLLLADLTPNQVEQLQRLGLELEPFGEQRWAVRTAPEPLAARDDCTDALLELSGGGSLEAAIVATACRTAIRNGIALTRLQMQTLLDQWQQTRNPRTCPHGRPICLTLEESSLSRYFRRHWVIGKSHGIER
ncbi:MAG TPA: DNA mismatch repair endonuclease MutL [Synechococcales cyanobacterium M55_K2018_004]|nr:DNA mismatch repair endonuclease MutL [Synechococcales cyanobacterium M55_K2018_004]